MSTSIGLGTHLVRDVTQAAANAVACGATWIDTAPNYASGHAQTLLAPILAANPQVAVSTKVGFFDKATAQAAIDDGAMLPEHAEYGHCLMARYLRWQIERSLAELGRERIDLMFLHNPERATGSAIWTAFVELEEQVKAGRIGGYGVATWDGFDAGVFNVPGLLDTARTAAWGDAHHLHAIQLPVSMVSIGAMSAALNGDGPIGDAAKAELQVFASSPLHGGDLPEMVTPELAALVGDDLTGAQAALAVVASTPGVSRVLLSASTTEHWKQAADTVARPVLPSSTMRRIVDVLAD